MRRWHSPSLLIFQHPLHMVLKLIYNKNLCFNEQTIVKNMFGLKDVYFQVFMIRLTLIVKTQNFLKPTFSDKNRIAAFHSFTQTNKIALVLLFGKHMRV
jgi:hypothetical protein